MKKLRSSYIKKATLFPLITIVALIIVSIIAVPKLLPMIPTATDATKAVKEYNADDYYLVNYSNFEDLRLNNFVGWLSSDDIALGCAVTYKSENEDTNAASLLSMSTEPWNDGTIVIIGSNTDKEFRNLHKAAINNTFNIEFHQHNNYTYKIKEIIPTKSKDEIKEYTDEADAILCLPYNDFSKFGKEYFYTLYVCDQVK